MTDFYSCYYSRQLPNGITLEVIPLTFGRARIVLADLRTFEVLDGW